MNSLLPVMHFLHIRMYSELVSSTIAEGGPFASRTSFVKLLRYELLLSVFKKILFPLR
jgi:hypothetical protein